MLSIIEQIKQGQLWDFHGGIHPPENKHISSRHPLVHAGIPDEITLPLKQHIGAKGEILVSVGDYVLKGQPLTQGNFAMSVPVHAPTSGTVTAIEPRTIAHPSGLSDLCIVISTDGEDRWCKRKPVSDYLSVDPAILIEKIRSAGISGMGGAGFPTSRKIQTGVGKADILIINAAECEPYITADDRLMQDHSKEVIEGIKILRHILTPKLTIIGIEDNKPEAIDALISASKDDDEIVIRVIPTKYPSGGSRQLLKILTGREVPTRGRSTDVGVIVQNVGTVFAIKKAICDAEPLIERVVTLTGNSIEQPGNVWALLGTSVEYLLTKHGYQKDKKHPRIIMGGSLMGYTLPHTEVPVTKITNCIITPTRKELPINKYEMACIRCSSCAEVCPSVLLPQQLYWYAKSAEYDKCEEYNLSDCIECGACAYVCPSDIPLVQYYRQAKSEIWARKEDVQKAERAKLRFEERKTRLEQDKADRENKFKLAAEQRKKTMLAKGEDNALSAAISRVKAQKSSESITEKSDTKPAVAAAIARAKAKQAASTSQSQPDNSEMQKLREERKQQAREKRAQQQSESALEKPTAKNAAVAAAIARAKAKKAQQAENSDVNEVKETAPAADPKKAAVAAAIARAKARKAQQVESSDNQANEAKESAPAADPKKAAVAAAIARAKARKAQQVENSNSEANEVKETAPAADPKKAAVAAAIARAKARKAQNTEQKDS